LFSLKALQHFVLIKSPAKLKLLRSNGSGLVYSCIFVTLITK